MLGFLSVQVSVSMTRATSGSVTVSPPPPPRHVADYLNSKFWTAQDLSSGLLALENLVRCRVDLCDQSVELHVSLAAQVAKWAGASQKSIQALREKLRLRSHASGVVNPPPPPPPSTLPPVKESSRDRKLKVRSSAAGDGGLGREHGGGSESVPVVGQRGGRGGSNSNSLDLDVSSLADRLLRGGDAEPSGECEDGRIGHGNKSGSENAVEVVLDSLARTASGVETMERLCVCIEQVLDLERLVGDAEDAIGEATGSLSPVLGGGGGGGRGDRFGLLMSCMEAVKSASLVEFGMGMQHTRRASGMWTQLTAAVDARSDRLDRVAHALRPALTLDYKQCICEAGWPPPLVSSSVDGQRVRTAGGGNGLVERDSHAHAVPRSSLSGQPSPNPLLLASNALKEKFKRCFVALTQLQLLQHERERRARMRWGIGDGKGDDASGAARLTSPKVTDGIQKYDAAGINMMTGEEKIGVNGYFWHSSWRASTYLWAMDALVEPIAERAKYHFTKWVDKPELVFALICKVVGEHTDALETEIQPLLDAPDVHGITKMIRVTLGAREEWVKSVVEQMAAEHLRSQVLPKLAVKVREEGPCGTGAALWLHMVDEALMFDMTMGEVAAGRSLKAGGRGAARGAAAKAKQRQGMEAWKMLEGQFAGCLKVFEERPDWLAVWAMVELEDLQKKIDMAVKADGAWEINLLDKMGASRRRGSGDGHGMALGHRGGDVDLSLASEYQPPQCVDGILMLLRVATDRCKGLPAGRGRLAFVRAVTAAGVREFAEVMRRQCEEVEACTSLSGEQNLASVGVRLNAARYVENALQEWGDEMFFLELRLWDAFTGNRRRHDGAKARGKEIDNIQGTVFDGEIDYLGQFRSEWTAKIISAVIRGFRTRCADYVRAKRRWSLDNVVTTSSAVSEMPSSGSSPASRTANRTPGMGPSTSEEDSGGDSLSPRQAAAEMGAYWQEMGGRTMQNNVTSAGYFPKFQDGLDVSPALCDALFSLRAQLSELRRTLDNAVFADVWRRVAASLDTCFLEDVVLGGGKFSQAGAQQLVADVAAVFSVFRGYCNRPGAFLKGLRDACVLLTLDASEVSTLKLMLMVSGTEIKGRGSVNNDGRNAVVGGQKEQERQIGMILRQNGVLKLSPAVVERILNQRLIDKRI
ncbi:hypothetical protein CBR_g20374 [Chara braunii]|uniref:Uncharacterized protein n=1 Tax=Chara braunii TaxID=69332 RepID=A0A388JU85_CHABU|nr:hypothetical protein CBR_g20374 [Chara braunii]|eukprot:GBG61340.1 hypothetical protein CBR_g20374 [Chara braunii]